MEEEEQWSIPSSLVGNIMVEDDRINDGGDIAVTDEGHMVDISGGGVQ